MLGVEDQDYDQIVQWMTQVLDHLNLDHSAESMTYDNSSLYDHAFYRISDSARSYWSPRLGYMPTDECLFRAFFEAEKIRLSRNSR